MQLLHRVPETEIADHPEPDVAPARPHFPVNLLFALIVILADSGMAAVEFTTFGAACLATVFVAMCLFPVGVLLQRYGATRSSWPMSLAISAGLCTLLAIPTSIGTLVPGAAALLYQLAGKLRTR